MSTKSKTAQEEGFAVLQLRTSRIRDAEGKKIQRGRLIAVRPGRADKLKDKGWAVDGPNQFDPDQVLDLIDQRG